MRASTRRTVLLTAIPFALLINSSQVHMTLQIGLDGTTRRSIVADVDPYYKAEIGKWVNDVQAGHPWDRTWSGVSGATYFYARDYRTQSLNRDTVNGQLTIEDVFQNPLSIYTTYTWHEEVTFSHLYPTDPSASTAAGKQVIYEVDMPGTVIDATVGPGKATPQGAGEGGVSARGPRRATSAINRAATRRATGSLFMSGAYAQAAAPGTAAPSGAAPGMATPGTGPAAAPAAASAPVTPAPGAATTGGTATASPTGAATPAPASPATPAAPAAPAETPGAAPAGGVPATGPAPAATAGTEGGTPSAASSTPAKRGASSVETQPGSAIFKLDASQEAVTIDVTSHRVRWGYLVILAYILAFVVFKVLEGLQKAARLRPRKI